MDPEASDVLLFANLNDADPVVIEAVNEARRTLPQFLDTALDMKLPRATYLVKVPFIDRSKTGETALVRTPETAARLPPLPICHLWLRVTSVCEGLLFCSVGEAPDALHLDRSVSFLIASESIEDWMINDGGTAFGGFSLRIIRSRLRKEGQMKFDAHTGIHEFKTLVP